MAGPWESKPSRPHSYLSLGKLDWKWQASEVGEVLLRRGVPGVEDPNKDLGYLAFHTRLHRLNRYLQIFGRVVAQEDTGGNEDHMAPIRIPPSDLDNNLSAT
mmetsp:Transcript_8571/g.14020  ORF Transcript_8571/g.14020 Transcript_8571/m.14020 type:complete len:102 (-) Transcript_8571:1205-1510(-)